MNATYEIRHYDHTETARTPAEAARKARELVRLYGAGKRMPEIRKPNGDVVSVNEIERESR